jgi:hypothetical protein
VITTEDLRRLTAAGHDRVLVGVDGRPAGLEGVAEDAPVPGLMVSPITEAVKRVEAGAVVHNLSRDTLWAVEGFLLDGRVIAALPDGIESGAGLIEAVTAAGFRWEILGRG